MDGSHASTCSCFLVLIDLDSYVSMHVIDWGLQYKYMIE